jgi:hypothetical protein
MTPPTILRCRNNMFAKPLTSNKEWITEVTLWLTVCQSVCLGIEHPCGTCDQILLPLGMLLSEICGIVSVGRPLWQEDGSAICSVITQSSESLRTRNHTLLSYLRLPQTGGPGSRIYIPLETGWPSYTPGNWVSGLQLSWVDVMTDGQSAYPSWCRAPLWNPWPDFFFPFFWRTIALLFDLERPLWREDGSAICSAICQWSE